MAEIKIGDFVYTPFIEVSTDDSEDFQIDFSITRQKVIDISQRGYFLIQWGDGEFWEEGSNVFATREEAIEAGKQQVLSRLVIDDTDYKKRGE